MATQETDLEDVDLELDENEPAEVESVDETARAVWEELSKEPDDQAADDELHGNQGQDDKKPDDATDVSKAASTLAKARKGKKRQVVEKEDLEPTTQQQQAQQQSPAQKHEAPQRFNAQEKEWFNKLEPTVQKHVAEIVNNFEGHRTKGLQEIAAAKQHYGAIDELVRTYTPKWNLQNMHPVAALRELCAVQDLIVADPVSGCAEVLRRAGVSLEDLAAYAQGGQVRQPAQRPQNSQLTRDDIVAVLRQEMQQAQQQQTLQGAVAEVRNLSSEMDQSGRYLWPELHDSNRIEGLKPLVDYCRRTTPGLSWSEATKQAILLTRGQPAASGSPTNGGPRLTQQEEIEKVRRASVSVKPRGNGAISNVSPAKAGESVADSARALYSQFFPD